MEDQTSVYPHESNFLQCDEMVDLIDPVVIRLPAGRSRPTELFLGFTTFWPAGQIIGRHYFYETNDVQTGP